MKPLRQKPPEGRSAEQLWNHYQVERAIADRLKSADKKGRKEIFRTMYDELFSKVPDHPRLTQRADPALIEVSNRIKKAVFGKYFKKDFVVVEFGSGDCEFSKIVAQSVKKIYSIDISDQRSPGKIWPDNFEHIVYDGETIPQLQPSSIDIVYSDQLLEHLHPEDAVEHLKTMYNLLKKGGLCIIKTPHALNGPGDISGYFSDKAEGFHLKEWTYVEIGGLLKKIGYRKVKGNWARGTRLSFNVPYTMFVPIETVLRIFPSGVKRKLSRIFIPSLICIAKK